MVKSREIQDLVGKPLYVREGVRISNDSGLSNKTMVSIGGVGIPVRRATIDIVPGELVEVTLVVRAEDLDVVAPHVELLLDERPRLVDPADLPKPPANPTPTYRTT